VPGCGHHRRGTERQPLSPAAVDLPFSTQSGDGARSTGVWGGSGGTLRREGYVGRLTRVDAEAGSPYDGPMSKQVLPGEDPERAALRSPRPGRIWERTGGSGYPRNLGLDSREVLLSDGARVQFDGVVVAISVRARVLPTGRGLVGIRDLRSLGDAFGLHEAVLAARSVVGAGLLGDGGRGCRSAALVLGDDRGPCAPL
jgi:hypothetical protein